MYVSGHTPNIVQLWERVYIVTDVDETPNEEDRSIYGSISEIMKILQIFCPTLTIYHYFIAHNIIQTYLCYVLIQS